MRIGFVAVAMLAALALVAVPAPAAKPQLKVTWDGSGVTEADGSFAGSYYVQGVPIHFAGHAMLNADGAWKEVHGTFDSTIGGEPVHVTLKTVEGGDLWPRGEGYHKPRLSGRADVTYQGTTHRDVLYSLEFVEYDFYDAWSQCWHIQYCQMNVWSHGWYFFDVTTDGGTDPIPNEIIDYRWFA